MNFVVFCHYEIEANTKGEAIRIAEAEERMPLQIDNVIPAE